MERCQRTKKKMHINFDFKPCNIQLLINSYIYIPHKVPTSNVYHIPNPSISWQKYIKGNVEITMAKEC